MPQMEGVGRALFACRPESVDRLSPEDRAACLRRLGFGRYRAADGSVTIKVPAYRDENALRISDRQARERSVADPCLIAKESRTECIHTVLYGDKLP